MDRGCGWTGGVDKVCVCGQGLYGQGVWMDGGGVWMDGGVDKVCVCGQGVCVDGGGCTLTCTDSH